MVQWDVHSATPPKTRKSAREASWLWDAGEEPTRLVVQVGGVGGEPQVTVLQLHHFIHLGAMEVDVGGQPGAGVACRAGQGRWEGWWPGGSGT